MDRDIRKGTMYQQLNQFFNLDGFGTLPVQNKDSKVIIKGKSPEDIRRKALELEQKRKLQDKFFRTTDRGFQKALQYEAARLPAYIDYEGMEYYPLIASALDLFMEEATTIGINGKMLNVYSNKDRIKFLLEEFFYNIINVNVNLPFWTRNLVKYGDNFVLIYGEQKKGITNVKQMVNYEVERFERIKDGKPIIKFKERMTGDEFNVFEVAHFRLLGDDKFLPYGCSILNKVRRVFRQLVMAEDAMLTYRIIRAGEKKVFKIDVGNIDEDDVEDYIYKVATKFKKLPEVDFQDGQIDYRFNVLGNDEDYFIPVRNANVQTGIDTLPGADNLDKIQDIEYLRDNLFMGLGVPKPFINFQDAVGGGKNMAQFDVRFAKKVNRVQQALIQELNKMAMVHLYLLGFKGEDLNDFELTLTNPSTQLDLLTAELYREKAQTYRDLTDNSNGIAAMSHTNAKRRLFNMSDGDIVIDLKQQKLEKVIQQEFADAPIVIKKSGVFKDIDATYGNPEAASGQTGQQQPGGEMGGAGAPPLGGVGGEIGGAPPLGGGEMGGAPPPLAESTNDLIDQLMDIGKHKKENKNSFIIETENKKLNNKANNMISEINNIINTTENLSNKLIKEDIEDIDNKFIDSLDTGK